jgi:hypothetical protein
MTELDKATQEAIEVIGRLPEGFSRECQQVRENLTERRYDPAHAYRELATIYERYLGKLDNFIRAINADQRRAGNRVPRIAAIDEAVQQARGALCRSATNLLAFTP